MSTPLLFIGDSPVIKSGLGRIGRDLAFLAARLPEFRVGYFGRGGYYTRSLPFPQYCFQPSTSSEWGEAQFIDMWKDFTRGEPGILFSIWDPSRVTWIGYPNYGEQDANLAALMQRHDLIRKWGYFAIDGTGVAKGGALTGLLRETLRGYDSCLAYGGFGARVIGESTGTSEIAQLPHGIDLRNFQPRDRSEARLRLGLSGDLKQFVVGCLMANQPRKDWGTLMQSIRRLLDDRPLLRYSHLVLICRTDGLFAHWNIPALIEDLDLGNTVRISTQEATDEELSWWYSACDLTVLPSLGEGFGYPIVESLACGVPVVHVDYAGGAELVRNFDESYLMEPTAYRLDTRWNVVRPVLSNERLAELIADKLLQIGDGLREPAERCRAAVERYSWPVLWPKWKRWLLEGVADEGC